MTCTKCGKPLQPGAKFCTFCGAPIASQPVIPPVPAPPVPVSPVPIAPAAVPSTVPSIPAPPSAAVPAGGSDDDSGSKPHGGNRKRRIIIAAIIAALMLILAIALAVVFLIILPGRQVGYNAIVHAAGPDSPKLCRNLLGDDKAMSKAFGYTVTATDPGDKADTGVCIYNDESRKPHTIRIGYVTSSLGAHAVAKAASGNGRYVIFIDKDSSITSDAANRLQQVFGRAVNRLKDDTSQWVEALPKLEAGMTVIPNQTVCEGRACNGMPQNGGTPSNGTTTGNGSGNGTANDGSSDGSESSGGTSDDESRNDADASTFPAVNSGTPTAYAYDTSLAVLDHPKAIKTKMADGTVKYVVPADGETFSLLDFRRSPANRCSAKACTWQSDASKSASITVGGKENKGADNVLDGVVANSAPAHGVFVVSAKAGTTARITVDADGDSHQAELNLDASADKTSKLGDDQAKKTAVDAAGRQGNACDRGCTASGVVTFDHPVWGQSKLVTLAMGKKAKTYDDDMGIARYDAGLGYVVISQSGQAMYGNFTLDPILDYPDGPDYSRYNMLPAMSKPDKSGNILLAAYDYPGGSSTADYAIAFHVGAGGDLQGVGFSDDTFSGGMRPLIVNAGDADKDGDADVTIAYGVDSGDGTAANSWRVDYRWDYDSGKGSYRPTPVETSENSALTNAFITANVLYNSETMPGTSDIIASQLSQDAEIFSWDSCQVKKVSDVKSFDYKILGGGTERADDPVDFSVGYNLYFLTGVQGPKQMDNLLAQGNKKYCTQAHTSGMGGVGGAGYPTASLQATSQSYDVKTRTAKLDMTINWSYPMMGSSSSGSSQTKATITIQFDKQGKLVRVDTTGWGSPKYSY